MSENNKYAENNSLVPCTFNWPAGPSQVSLCGQFDLEGIPNWSQMPLEWQESNNCFHKTLLLPAPKEFTFKFVVDGNWVCHPTMETRHDSSGFMNNHISVEPLVQPVEPKAATPEDAPVEAQAQEDKYSEIPPVIKEPKVAEYAVETKEPEVAEKAVETIEPEIAEKAIETEEPKVAEYAVESKEPKVAEYAVESKEPKVTENAVETKEPEIAEKAIENKEPEKAEAVEKSPLVSSSEASETTENNSSLELNVNNLDTYNYQYTAFQDDQDDGSSDSANLSQSSSEVSVILSQKGGSNESVSIRHEEPKNAIPDQASGIAAEGSLLVLSEALNADSIVSYETAPRHVEASKDHEHKESEAAAKPEPTALENTVESDSSSSSDDIQTKDTLSPKQDEVFIEEAINQLRNEVMADQEVHSESRSGEIASPNSTLVPDRVYARSLSSEHQVDDGDDSKPSMQLVLCSLTMSYAFYGLLAVSTIVAKKSATMISSRVLSMIETHSGEAAKITEQTASEVHELNFFEIVVGLTLVASGMTVAFILSSFKSRN